VFQWQLFSSFKEELYGEKREFCSNVASENVERFKINLPRSLIESL
jgi:hypothetical protein